MAAIFPYLPDQTYVPVGVLNTPDAYPPELHCFSDKRPKWLHLDDGLPEANGTGRDILNEANNG